MQRKYFLYLVLGICAFTAAYLYYQDTDRKNSIEKYFYAPKVGDVYKIKSDNEDGEHWLRYYKLAGINNNQLVFYASKMMADASADILLNHFDTTRQVIFTKIDLQEIKEGKWKNDKKNNTTLVEIVRRN